MGKRREGTDLEEWMQSVGGGKRGKMGRGEKGVGKGKGKENREAIVTAASLSEDEFLG